MRDEAERPGAAELDEVPPWVRPFFRGRPDTDLSAWWEASRRLYGPLGVRMDFRAQARAAPDEHAAAPSPA